MAPRISRLSQVQTGGVGVQLGLGGGGSTHGLQSGKATGSVEVPKSWSPGSWTRPSISGRSIMVRLTYLLDSCLSDMSTFAPSKLNRV